MTACCCLGVVGGNGPPRVRLLYDISVWVPTLLRIFVAGLLAGLPANFLTFFKMPGLFRPDWTALSIMGQDDHANKSSNERANCHTRQLGWAADSGRPTKYDAISRGYLSFIVRRPPPSHALFGD